MRRDALRALWRSEREKLRGRSPRSAALYIWDYYRLWIIGLGSALALTLFLIWRIATNVPNTWFVVIFANTRADLGSHSPLWEEFVARQGYDLSEGRVEFRDEVYFDYTANQARGNQYYELFVAMADSGELDALVIQPEMLTALGESGRLLDLGREECRTLRERYADRLLYSLPADTDYSTEPVPVGIDLSGSSLDTRFHAYPDGCALGVSAQCAHLDAVEAFLEAIFEEVEDGA